MKYRDAVLLKEGDQVIRASDNMPIIISSLEKFGQFKIVKILYKDSNNKELSLFNTEVY
jgi:Leucine-rich repeat (LRR) protein